MNQINVYKLKWPLNQLKWLFPHVAITEMEAVCLFHQPCPETACEMGTESEFQLHASRFSVRGIIKLIA